MTFRATIVLSLLAVVVTTSGCPVQKLDVRDCTDDEMEFIDHAIGEAAYVEPYVNQALADEFSDVETTYADIIETLVRVRSKGGIHCGDAAVDPVGAYSSGGDFRSYADPLSDTIVMSTVRLGWVTPMVNWQDGRPYAEIDVDDLPELVAGMDKNEFMDLKGQAEDYLTSPSIPAYVLVHEAAHIEMNVAHDREHLDDNRYREFITDIGIYAAYGICWERWVPENEWLDYLYRSSHE